MKRIYILLTLSIVLLLSLTNCIVTSSSYSIVFQNNSDKAATLKVGGHSMWVTAGGDFYYVLYTTQSKASIEVTGVSIEGVFYGPAEVESVDLEFGYQYNFNLTLNDGEYFLSVGPVYVGDQQDSEAGDLFTFK